MTGGSVGDTAFPSVNTVDSSVDGSASSASAIAIGRTIKAIQGDIFVAVAPSTGADSSTAAESVPENADHGGGVGRNGRGASDAGYARTESGPTMA